jgi:O-antigen ligase
MTFFTDLLDFAAWRDRILMAALFLLPWQARIIRSIGVIGDAPWEQGTVGLFALEIVILAALLCHLLAKGDRPPQRGRPPSHFRLWGAFILLGAFSAFWARDLDAAMFTWFHLFEGFALAYLIWVSRAPTRFLVGVFLAGMVLAAGLGLWQFLSQRTFSSSWLGISAHPAEAPGSSVVETLDGRFLRSYGPLPHPNVFGGYMAAALLLAAGLFLEQPIRTRGARFLAAAQALFVAGLAVSLSRSAAAGYALAAFAALSVTRRLEMPGGKHGLRKAVVLQAIAALAVLSLIWPLVATRATSTGRLEGKSLSERAYSVGQGFALFQLNPALGVGLGNMVPAAYEDLRPYRPAWLYQPAHFLPALAAAELGFLGLMLLLGGTVFWLLEGVSAARHAAGPLARFAALGPLILVVVGAFDHYPLTQFSGTMLAGLLFGLSLKASETAS